MQFLQRSKASGNQFTYFVNKLKSYFVGPEEQIIEGCISQSLQQLVCS